MQNQKSQTTSRWSVTILLANMHAFFLNFPRHSYQFLNNLVHPSTLTIHLAPGGGFRGSWSGIKTTWLLWMLSQQRKRSWMGELGFWPRSWGFDQGARGLTKGLGFWKRSRGKEAWDWINELIGIDIRGDGGGQEICTFRTSTNRYHQKWWSIRYTTNATFSNHIPSPRPAAIPKHAQSSTSPEIVEIIIKSKFVKCSLLSNEAV